MSTAPAVTIAVLASLTPAVTCLIGIILSRPDTRDLRAKMITLRNQVQSDSLLIHARVATVEAKQAK